jgi:hypothetical protein
VLTRFDRSLILGLGVYTAVLAALPMMLSAPNLEWVLSEAGPYEISALFSGLPPPVRWLFESGPSRIGR